MIYSKKEHEQHNVNFVSLKQHLTFKIWFIFHFLLCLFAALVAIILMQYSRREKENGNRWTNPIQWHVWWFFSIFDFYCTKCKALKIVLIVFIVFWLFSKKIELCFESFFSRYKLLFRSLFNKECIIHSVKSF